MNRVEQNVRKGRKEIGRGSTVLDISPAESLNGVPIQEVMVSGD